MAKQTATAKRIISPDTLSPKERALLLGILEGYSRGKEQEKRKAERAQARQAKLAVEPEDEHYPETDGLEEQARHAMRIVTAVRLALYGELMEEEERHALAGLLWGAEDLLKKLDLQRVGLDRKIAIREAKEAAQRGRKAA